MRCGGFVLLTLLLSPAALADCAWVGGPGLAPEVWNRDRRELEQLLATPLEHAACARMQRVGRLKSGFIVRRGYLVLTNEEILFVSDRRDKEILFRADFAGVRELERSPSAPVVLVTESSTQFLHVATEAGRFEFELTCEAAGRLVADEIERRTAGHLPLVPQRRGAREPCD
jgi:hypothetical protein